MECPQCHFSNPPGSTRCVKCSTDFGTSADSPPHGAARTPPAPSITDAGETIDLPAHQLALKPGSVLGGRYEILELLGQGGMGAVYKTRDRELDRMVALKIIRSELAGDAEILRRFKQELILARQVTHKNVIRIFDLSEAEGVKFITMEYIEGEDLRTVLRQRGKLPPSEAVGIVEQVCRALDAAHSEGVIHRDLKPQNIVVDKQGKAHVMDFGIARSTLLPGMTQTGALIGTPEYMSPEQAKGLQLDARSDLFSLGIIFYESLTGRAPYQADTTMALLWKRVQERARPPVELDSTIPRPLSDIVCKCLEVNREKRYASAAELLEDLESLQGPRPGTRAFAARAAGMRYGLKWGLAGALVLALVTVVIAIRLIGPPKPKAAHAPVSVLVADFTNHTGDPIFDGTLEPMVNIALEGASFINAYSRGDARKLAQKLPHPAEKLDEQAARLVAVSQAVSVVMTGEISRRGDHYSVSVTALDSATGNVLAQADVPAANKDEVLLNVPKLAAPIRKALGDTTPESVQIEKAGGAFTAANLEGVHQYGVAMQQEFAGDVQGAFRSFSKAAELDPNFARAYAGMAGIFRNQGKLQDSEKYIKLAMAHVDRMTERERSRVRGEYYAFTGNSQKCVDEYSELVNRYPADNLGQLNLAGCSMQLRNIPKAVEAARRAVEIAPKGALQRLNLSFYSSYGGDFKTGEREARAALELNPSSEVSYLALAEAQLGQGEFSQASETYHKLEKLSALGNSMAASGLADLALSEGHFADAVRILEQGAAADLAAKNPENAGDKLAALAHVKILQEQKRTAIVTAEKASANNRAAQVRFLVAQTLLEAGESAKAQKLATNLASELQAEPQAYARIIEGGLALKRRDSAAAIKTLMDANKLLDTWIGRFELGRAYLEAGLFVEADSEFDRCLKRRGEALELFMNNVPTIGYVPQVYYYQGHAREGLKSPGFAESYQTYLSIRGKSTEDPLLPEIRRRLGQ